MDDFKAGDIIIYLEDNSRWQLQRYFLDDLTGRANGVDQRDQQDSQSVHQFLFAVPLDADLNVEALKLPSLLFVKANDE